MHTYADRTPAIEQHSIYERITDDVQVPAITCRFEISIAGGDPHTVANVHRIRRDSPARLRVRIVTPRHAELARCLRQAPVRRSPSLTRYPLDGRWTTTAVDRRLAVNEIGLQPLE